MCCLTICGGQRRTLAPRDEREVVLQDTVVSQATRNLVSGWEKLRQYGNGSQPRNIRELIQAEQVIARTAKDSLLSRTMQLSETAPSGAASRVRLNAIMNNFSQNLEAIGMSASARQTRLGEFMVDVKESALQKAVERIARNEGVELATGYSREAKRLVAYGYYKNIDSAYSDVRAAYMRSIGA